MDFINSEIEQYALNHSLPELDILKKINRETYAKVMMPRMLSGHMQGNVLRMLSKMIKPKYILEIGTYTGYSAICLTQGLSENGKLFTIDINEELEKMVRDFFEQAKLSGKIDYLIGNALQIIPQLNQTFDLVFIDADKKNYSAYYDLVFDKVNKGGYIITDNVLWSGKVLHEKKDEETHLIDQFNKKIANDVRVENILLPIRDGLLITQKL
jgi:caffeoyl-CoA O-methyltransferase